jgi:hypothetical protein
VTQALDRVRKAHAGNLAQPARLLLDDVEHSLAKGVHQLLRIDRPDAADHARAEIFLDALNRCRRRSFEERGPELDAMRAVVDPSPARLNEFAGGNHRSMADNGDRVALAAGFDAEHAEAIVRVVEGDPVNESRQDLRRAHRRSGPSLSARL